MSRILIVDDEPENREAMKRALGDDNPDWSIMTTDSYIGGLKIIQQKLNENEPIDIVLTDLVMQSESDGMNMLTEAVKLDPYIMAILFTAKERCLDRYQALTLGAFDVVEKNIRGKSSIQEIMLKARAALKYREWSLRINSLSRFFDPRVFAKIEQDQTLLLLQERIVTICFWDIRGFSKLCETLKGHPRLISGFLREYSDIAASTVFEYDGILDKFIGDGVMALFGVLSDVNDKGKQDAVSAARAALNLHTKFTDLYNKWKEEWMLYTPEKLEIGLGCGIHTGNCLVGNVGGNFRDQFTALGPDVNFASRIESRSTSGQILISQSTAQRISENFLVEPNGDISDIKNIPGTFPIFSLQS